MSRIDIKGAFQFQHPIPQNFVQIQADLYGEGVSVALTGNASTATDIDPSVGTEFVLTTAGAGTNDFDVMAPAYDGQLIKITNTNTGSGQNATITEDSGVTMLTAVGGAVASITLDADAEFAYLRARNGLWVIDITTGTVA